jgi:hypothetical protein
MMQMRQNIRLSKSKDRLGFNCRMDSGVKLVSMLG